MMKVAALFSGGKDSVFSIYITQQYGWDVTHLVTLASENKASWMFHSINIHLTDLLSEALGIPLLRRTTKGEKERELQDLQGLLQGLPIDGVISGAIASEYQRTRIERVCDLLGIKSFTPLWHKNPELLLRDQLRAGFKSIIVGVFANGFNETWLGKQITEETILQLLEHQKRFGINIAGEGGEFETLVLDGPIFTKRLVIDEAEKEWCRDSGVLQVKRAHLSDS
ncbi:MAG TPA: TIGR00289 family protein [Candidatus Thermoplasmatota archaeon]|nr:TIGR00289 family protein [Candidatus Thermoplasmatota archaeon]